MRPWEYKSGGGTLDRNRKRKQMQSISDMARAEKQRGRRKGNGFEQSNQPMEGHRTKRRARPEPVSGGAKKNNGEGGENPTQKRPRSANVHSIMAEETVGN